MKLSRFINIILSFIFSMICAYLLTNMYNENFFYYLVLLLWALIGIVVTGINVFIEE